MRDRTIRDHFGNEIEVGDRYFYGSPPTHGIVIKIRQMSIVIETGGSRWEPNVNHTMNCKSPDKGVCLDRVPEDIFA